MSGLFYRCGWRARSTCLVEKSPDTFFKPDGEILLARFTEADVLAKKLTGPKSKLKMLISRPLARRQAGAPR